MRITAVNNDITLFKVGDELLDKGVNGITSLDKEDDFAWLLQLGNEFLNGVSTLNICTWGVKIPSIKPRDEKEAKRNNQPFASLARKLSTLEVVRL